MKSLHWSKPGNCWENAAVRTACHLHPKTTWQGRDQPGAWWREVSFPSSLPWDRTWRCLPYGSKTQPQEKIWGWLLCSSKAGERQPPLLFHIIRSLCFPSRVLVKYSYNPWGEHLQLPSLGPLWNHTGLSGGEVRWENSNALATSSKQNPWIPAAFANPDRSWGTVQVLQGVYSLLPPH